MLTLSLRRQIALTEHRSYFALNFCNNLRFWRKLLHFSQSSVKRAIHWLRGLSLNLLLQSFLYIYLRSRRFSFAKFLLFLILSLIFTRLKLHLLFLWKLLQTESSCLIWFLTDWLWWHCWFLRRNNHAYSVWVGHQSTWPRRLSSNLRWNKWLSFLRRKLLLLLGRVLIREHVCRATVIAGHRNLRLLKFDRNQLNSFFSVVGDSSGGRARWHLSARGSAVSLSFTLFARGRFLLTRSFFQILLLLT